MVTTNFKVQKRKISQIDSVPYTGEYNIDTFKFEFDEEWEGLDKTLVFISGDNRYNIALLNDEALMPFEMYQIKGNIQIGLFGTDNGLRTLATGWLPLYIEEDSYEVSVEPENLPTPTQWDLYVTEINRLLELCQASQEQCESIQAQIEEDYEQYLSDLNQIKSDTLGYKNDTQALKNETNQIKNDVIGLKNQVESDIADAELRISEYNANAQTKTNQFNQNATSKTSAFNLNYTEKLGSINTAGSTQVSAVNTAGTTQVGNVETAGSTQVGLVNTAGTKAIENVESAEDTAIENIEEAGESYDVRINQLLDQIPVGTVEEKTINVQDSSNLTIKDIAIKGNTSQDGTPTQSEPVDVKVVTGDVTININNVNFFDFQSLVPGYHNSATSWNTDGWHTRLDKFIGVEENEKIKIIIRAKQDIQIGRFFIVNYDKPKMSNGLSRTSPSIFDTKINANQDVSYEYTVPIGSKYLQFSVYTLKVKNGDVYTQVSNLKNSLENYVDISVSKNVTNEQMKSQSQYQLLSLGSIELCKIGDYQDYLWRDNSNEKLYKHKAVEKIASYNGETISTTYLSTTGELSIGATVYYVLTTPTEEEITDTTLLSQLESLYNLKTYKNITNIYATTQNEVPILNVTYRKDLQTLTDKIALLDARLSLLE